MDTLYVIPADCPRENLYAVSNAWELGAIKQSIFEAITPREGLPKGMEVKLNNKVFLSWTCSGCVVGLGDDEKDLPCPQRQCGLGGKPLGPE
jgi:hypothetical protein